MITAHGFACAMPSAYAALATDFADMIDCHIHMILDGVYWKDAIKQGPREDICRRRLERYQRLGYTYLRDGGDRWGAGALARSLAPA